MSIFHRKFARDLIENLKNVATIKYSEVKELPIRNKSSFYHVCIKTSVSNAVWKTLQKYYKNRNVRTELFGDLVRASFSFLKHMNMDLLVRHFELILPEVGNHDT